MLRLGQPGKDPALSLLSTPENRIVSYLIDRGKTIATAESCSGGLIAHRLTNVPGASTPFLGGVVAYSNAVKRSLLQVAPEIIEACGAVSEETARAMAEGARRALGTDMAVAVTGIAGPGGGTPKNPSVWCIWPLPMGRPPGWRSTFLRGTGNPLNCRLRTPR